MEKLYALTKFLKMAGGRMHISHPIPLDPPLAISYGKHQKSLAYFNHLAPLVLFFFTKRRSKSWGGMAQRPPLKYAPEYSAYDLKVAPQKWMPIRAV